MGTRHLVAIIKDKKYKVAQYGQWDGYFSGQGIGVLEYLRNLDLDILKNKLDNCRFMNEDDICKIENDPELKDNWQKHYPQLSRNIGSDIIDYVYNSENELLVKDSSTFAEDSLFCEYGYVVDFDKNTFEIYEGFNETPLNKSERFYCKDKKDKYYPIKFICEFDINNLPSDDEFINKLKQLTSDEQE